MSFRYDTAKLAMGSTRIPELTTFTLPEAVHTGAGS
jgi:hypothetical protein